MLGESKRLRGGGDFSEGLGDFSCWGNVREEDGGGWMRALDGIWLLTQWEVC